MIDRERLQCAFDKALAHLLGQMRPEGYWEGHLSSSALSTATAISALALAKIDSDIELIKRSVEWLAETQCTDGGWGDTPDSPSNLSTTLLSASALILAKAIVTDEEAIRKADDYITAKAGASASERSSAIQKIYGADRTFAVPILMNCAMAGIVSWSDVPPLPFELAIFPRSWYKALRLQVVSYALPALIAVGLNIHRHNPSWNPFTRALRSAVTKKVLAKLATLQPSNGGFLEATPLTCFVAMSLIPTLTAKQPVAAKCLDFARESQRKDGSWPIDTNLSTWVTSCAVSALAESNSLNKIDVSRTAKWIADRQYQDTHPFTGAAPGGWGWTHLPGGVPDADDTSGAILTLNTLARAHSSIPSILQPSSLSFLQPSILSSVEGCGQISPRASTGLSMLEGHSIDTIISKGIQWMIDLQNTDGGWPTFCRGWGQLPFDKSSPDITAHALRALKSFDPNGKNPAVARAIKHGFGYLTTNQRSDGSWVPLWFGNQYAKDAHNPVLGTSRVLLALSDSVEADKGLKFLLGAQNSDGGWGGDSGVASSIEETALAVIALANLSHHDGAKQAVARGVRFLIECVEDDSWQKPSPIGLYFASLWYSEEIYPVSWTVEALGRALTTGASAPAQGKKHIF